MSTDPSDSVYDFVPVERVRPGETPLPAVAPVAPVKLEYQRVAPPSEAMLPAGAKATDEPPRKLSFEERLYYLLRALGSLGIVALGLMWLIFVDHVGFVGPAVGFGLIGLGFAGLMMSGPSEAEKKGYHF